MSQFIYSPNIAINVRNSEAAIQFYKDTLGFNFKNPHEKTGCGTEMTMGPLTFWIDACTPEQENSVGQVFFEFKTDKLQDTLKFLETHGCKKGELTETPTMKGCMISDPFGMKFHVYESQNEISPVEKVAFTLVYAENLENSVQFYTKYLGFVIDKETKMGGDQVYGSIGPVGLWIGGGHKKSETNENTTRATAMLRIKSASTLFQKMSSDGVKLYQEKPIAMNSNSHWFQFADIDGNIWDVLGGE